MPFVVVPQASKTYKPTFARPHPPVDHAGATVALAVAVFIDAIWLAGVPLPHGAAATAVMTITAGWAFRRMRKALRSDPRMDLFMPVELSGLLVLGGLLVVAAYNIARDASAGGWFKTLFMLLVAGGLFVLVPGSMAGHLLANRAAEGGEVPPGSRARRAVALGPWRSIASILWPANTIALIPAMGHAKSPMTSVGSLVALACALLLLYVMIAQQYWLRSSPPQPPARPGGSSYREAQPRPVEDPAPADLREKIASRELKRGFVALVFALIPLALHAWLLFG